MASRLASKEALAGYKQAGLYLRPRSKGGCADPGRAFAPT